MFPAYAGMIRQIVAPPSDDARVPRLRGDDPSWPVIATAADDVFPAYAGMIRYGSHVGHGDGDGVFPAYAGMIRIRSWRRQVVYRRVFPAYAGMIRMLASNLRSITRVPRLRGDDPIQNVVLRTSHGRLRVFPAYAGMIRGFGAPGGTLGVGQCVPRLRGDDPTPWPSSTVRPGCSPPTRG